MAPHRLSRHIGAVRACPRRTPTGARCRRPITVEARPGGTGFLPPRPRDQQHGDPADPEPERPVTASGVSAMLSLALIMVGFLLAKAAVMALARASTARWVRDKRAAVASSTASASTPLRPRLHARRPAPDLLSDGPWSQTYCVGTASSPSSFYAAVGGGAVSGAVAATCTGGPADADLAPGRCRWANPVSDGPSGRQNRSIAERPHPGLRHVDRRHRRRCSRPQQRCSRPRGATPWLGRVPRRPGQQPRHECPRGDTLHTHTSLVWGLIMSGDHRSGLHGSGGSRADLFSAGGGRVTRPPRRCVPIPK